MSCNHKMKLKTVGKIVVTKKEKTAQAWDQFKCEFCGLVVLKNPGESYSVNVDKMKKCAELRPDFFVIK